ncbi:uncharacterized protein LOC107857594 isoform X2 [Capsicum annuum]|uniref:uncharacterized protein LOC107857594 isoform X2 n=1 Tax=Capsicum annuum TaxID=4072 RepID=UPI001FB1464E|nr:uncharacterized protein LOC107857594 isoform X2 [Capsicum annuum]
MASSLTDFSNSIFTPIKPTTTTPRLLLPHNFPPRNLAPCRAASINRRQLIADTAAAIVLPPLLGVGLSPLPAKADDVPLSEWERVFLPIDPGVVLLDIAFVPDDPNHGFLLGTRQTILETKDGGSTWVPRSIASAEEEDFNYRFNSISFKGKEGWIIGKPAILLYTSDAGENWERIPLSSQLPGDMLSISNGGFTRGNKNRRPRSFDLEAREKCWSKAEKVPGRDPERWRKDAADNIVGKRFHSCQGCLCFEYDHVVPFSKGGDSVSDNCQILQTRVNRSKADKVAVGTRHLKGYSCDINFSDKDLDKIEMAVYGDIKRSDNQCRVPTTDEILGKYKSRNRIASCNSQ